MGRLGELETVSSHLHDYRIIICKVCQYAVLSGQIKAHLSKLQSNISLKYSKLRQLLAVQGY